MNKLQMQKENRKAEIEQREFLKGKEVELNLSKYGSKIFYKLFYNGSLWYCKANKEQVLDYIYFLNLRVTKITHYNYNIDDDDAVPF